MEKKKESLIKPYLKRHGLKYIMGLILLLVVDYMSLVIPQITGDIIDGLTGFTIDKNGVLRLVFYLILATLAIVVGRVLYRSCIFGSCRKIEAEIRNDLFHKLEELSQKYYNHHKTGDLMANFTNDLDALRNAIGQAVISTFDAVVQTGMVLYKMIVYVNPTLTFITLIPMSMIAIAGFWVSDEMEKRFEDKQIAFAKLSDQVQESITGERVIKAFVQEDTQDQLFSEVNQYNKKMNMKVVKMFAFVFPALDLVIGIGYVIAIIYGGYLAVTAQITLGRFVAFTSYIGILVWPMIAMGDSITMFSQGRAAIARIKAIFDEQPDIIDDENVKDVQELTGHIQLNHLSFNYQSDLPNALDDLSVEIQPGETFAILGRTGSGKTTLVNLLTRLYDVETGMLQIDHTNIREIPLKVLREHIAYVPQDNYLFSDSLENNIKFSKLDASHDEVVQACKDACVHDNIIDFPMQYETVVGERGVTLSGGQKQRCSIARALLKEAQILILDDALSAVDTDTEDQILEHLKTRRKNQTTIMIAHRISTVRNADHILVLDEGKKAEYGTFEELMAKNGIFKEMYDKQQLEKQLTLDM